MTDYVKSILIGSPNILALGGDYNQYFFKFDTDIYFP